MSTAYSRNNKNTFRSRESESGLYVDSWDEEEDKPITIAVEDLADTEPRKGTIQYDKMCDYCRRDTRQTSKNKETGDTTYYCFHCNTETIRYKQTGKIKKGKLSAAEGTINKEIAVVAIDPMEGRTTVILNHKSKLDGGLLALQESSGTLHFTNIIVKGGDSRTVYRYTDSSKSQLGSPTTTNSNSQISKAPRPRYYKE